MLRPFLPNILSRRWTSISTIPTTASVLLTASDSLGLVSQLSRLLLSRKSCG